MTVFAAVDIGASGGRVIAGVVDGGGVTLHEVHRFANGCARRDGHLRWDLTGLYEQVLVGLAKVPEAASIGIDTWAVDYGLLDEDGTLVAEPVAYRDDRTAAVIDDVHAAVPFDELYRITGIQHLPFNTIYQLAAEPLLERAAHVVLLPDLIAHRLTGALATEATNASTTALVDVRTGDWCGDLLARLGIPAAKLPPIERPGAVRGTWNGIPVVTVGSHDTASAVVGVPMTERDVAYIASGTWSLVGLELDEPVLDDPAFTNERGVDDRIRFLRNVGGLWLLQECLREWRDADLGALLAEAATVPTGPLVDVDDETFIAPGDMPARIAAAAGTELSRPATVRCIVDSLAAGHAATLARASELADHPVRQVHLVGGGAQNELLCQATADATGCPVVAGPVEATALGNVVVQARAHGALSGDLEDLRRAVAATTSLRRYEPV